MRFFTILMRYHFMIIQSYIKSLENNEILTNITLKRERANSILNRDKVD